MSTSSQPEIYSVTLDDTIKFSDTITLTSPSVTSNVTWAGSSGTYSTVSGFNGSSYTIGPITTVDTISIDTSTFKLPVEWESCFPAWHRVEDMCKQYPALEIALRNFRTVYELVKDDYDNPTPKK